MNVVNPNSPRVRLVRRLMDEGLTQDEISQRTGLAPKTVENYQYAARRPGEAIRPNGRRLSQGRRVKFTARMQFTAEQLARIRAGTVRYGCPRPAILMEILIATICDDDLFTAVLGDDPADVARVGAMIEDGGAHAD